jgi:release factor glutamine methyltransferase
VFSTVDGTFDLIIFDPPFRWFAPRDLLEAASADESYRALTTFFLSARHHLAPNGRMLVFFGTSGDLGYLQQLMARHRSRATTVGHKAAGGLLHLPFVHLGWHSATGCDAQRGWVEQLR